MRLITPTQTILICISPPRHNSFRQGHCWNISPRRPLQSDAMNTFPHGHVWFVDFVWGTIMKLCSAPLRYCDGILRKEAPRLWHRATSPGLHTNMHTLTITHMHTCTHPFIPHLTPLPLHSTVQRAGGLHGGNSRVGDAHTGKTHLPSPSRLQDYEFVCFLLLS